MTGLPVDDLAVLRRRRSVKWQTYPPDVLPLPVAEMDFALAPAVSAALHAAVDASDTGYAFAQPALGQALARFAADRWDWQLDAGSVVPMPDVGVGAAELIRAAGRAGDAVVISPPVYPPFFAWVEETGTRRVEAPLRQQADGAWRLDLDRLQDAFAQRPAAYVLCNPHNPVGRVHDRSELTALAELAARYEVTVIADEIHAPLVLPGARFTPFLTVPGGADVGISLVSASKAFNLAGLKCAAAVTASPAVAPVIDRLPPTLPWRVGQLGLLASLAAFDEGGDWLDALIATLDDRRRQLGALLAEQLPQLRWSPPEATYLAWLDCRAVGEGNDPRELFLERGKVGLEAGLNFGTPGSGWVRLNFGTGEQILDEAIGRMAAALR